MARIEPWIVNGVQQSGTDLFFGPVERTIRVIAKTLEERSDPAMIFNSEVEVTLI